MHLHLPWLGEVFRTRTGLGFKLLLRDTTNVIALKINMHNRYSCILAHLGRRLVGELRVYYIAVSAFRPSSSSSVVRREHFQTTSPLKPLR